MEVRQRTPPCPFVYFLWASPDGGEDRLCTGRVAPSQLWGVEWQLQEQWLLAPWSIGLVVCVLDSELPRSFNPPKARVST